MGKINVGRVILGGIVAGIVIDLFEGVLNGVVLSTQLADVMTSLGKPSALSVQQLAAFNLIGLATGIVMVALYAAIRPRLGAGPKTAMVAGLAVWVLAYAFSGAGLVVTHLFPMGLMITALAIQIVEVLVAGVAGAAVYKEDAAGAARTAAARA
jgi:hypothetical protein